MNKYVTNLTLPNGTNVLIKDNECRTNIAKLKIYVTPEMFGAKGDGVTDDTVAIQSALDMCGKIEFSQNKTYIINNTLLVSSNSNINFNNCTIKASDNWIGNSDIKSMICNKNPSMGNEEKNKNIVIRNLNLNNNNISEAGKMGVLQFRGVINSLVENVKITCSGDNVWGAILFSANKDITFNSIYVYNNSDDGSLGGCFWVRNALNGGMKTENIIINDSHFENCAVDDCVCFISYRDNNSITVKMNNCYILGKATNTYPSFVLTIRSSGTDSFLESVLNGVTVEGNCSNSLVAISGENTSGMFSNSIIHSTNGNGILVQDSYFPINDTIITSNNICVSGAMLHNCRLNGQANNCRVVENCVIECKTTACEDCNKIIDSLIKTRGTAIHYYGLIKDVICSGNTIYSDNTAIHAQLKNDASIDSAIITNNKLQRWHGDTSNAGTIGINIKNATSTICKNNIIYAKTSDANSFGFRYSNVVGEGVSVDNIIKQL